MQEPLRHDADASRYEYLVDGHAVAVVDYRIRGDQIEMHHTFTQPRHRGHGIAARLVAGALDDVRERGLRVVPACWFVAEFIDAHPAYADLLAEPSPRS